MARPKGSPNKITGQVREMVTKALHDEGGVIYLRRMANEEPRGFLALVSKLMPSEHSLDPESAHTLADLVAQVRK